jgi:hypothetical protein
MRRKKQKSEEELDFEAADLISSAYADKFARALDRCGWQIIVKPEVGAEHAAVESPPGRWPMSTPGYCPAWAEPFDTAPPVRSAKILPFVRLSNDGGHED